MRGVECVAGEDCGEEGGEADHQQWPSRAGKYCDAIFGPNSF